MRPCTRHGRTQASRKASISMLDAVPEPFSATHGYSTHVMLGNPHNRLLHPQAPERSSSWLVSLGSGDDLVNIEDIDVIDQFVGEGVAGIELLLDHLLVEEPIVVGLIIGANTFAPALNPRLIRVKAPCLGTGFEQFGLVCQSRCLVNASWLGLWENFPENVHRSLGICHGENLPHREGPAKRGQFLTLSGD